MKAAQDNLIKNVAPAPTEGQLLYLMRENIIYINAFSTNENSIKIVFDPINVKLLSISNHVETFWGYTPKEILQMDILSWLNSFTKDTLSTPLILKKWLHHSVALLTDSPVTHFKMSCCGLQIRHKRGHFIRVLGRYSLLETSEGLPQTAVITINNIAHLMQMPFYWGRGTWGATQHHFISKSSNSISQDILSYREKQVLNLLAQGLSSHKIADRLFISVHTVDHHRRNMIARTGLRDTTALLQVMHMIGLLAE